MVGETAGCAVYAWCSLASKSRKLWPGLVILALQLSLDCTDLGKCGVRVHDPSAVMQGSRKALCISNGTTTG